MRCLHTGKSPELALAEGPAHASHSSGHSSPSAQRGRQVRGQPLQGPFTLELTAFFPNEQRFSLPSALSERTRAAPGLVKSGEAQPHHGDVPSPSQRLKSPFPEQNLSFQRSSAGIGGAVCGEPSPPRTARTGREAPQTLGDFGYVSPAPWLRQRLGPWPQKCCCPTAPQLQGALGSPPYLVQHQVVLPIPQCGAVGAHQPHKGHGENPLAPVLGWEGTHGGEVR